MIQALGVIATLGLRTVGPRKDGEDASGADFHAAPEGDIALNILGGVFGTRIEPARVVVNLAVAPSVVPN